MIDRIQQTFEALKRTGSTAIIPYITLGDPDLDTTCQSILSMTAAGADMIEIGIPYTDPVADGPTIQKACDRALKNPFDMENLFLLTRKVRDAGVEIPLVAMSYANPVMAYGFEHYCRNCVESGIDGSLITDMPPEESSLYLDEARRSGLKTVFLCSPTTSDDRIRLIDKASSGFVYYVARTGVTGVRSDIPDGIAQRVLHVKSLIQNPLCIGFGISTPEQARVLAPEADGLVIGSAIVRLFEEYSGDALQSRLFTLIDSLKDQTHAIS